MPLFAIHLPKDLDERFPHLKEYLHANNEALTTWLDIHEMLRDIVNGTYSPREIPSTYSLHRGKELKTKTEGEDQLSLKRAYSLWREIVPKSRTCESALIPDHFCVCEDRKQLDAQHEIALSSSQTLVQIINENLPQETCLPLTLDKIMSAEVSLVTRE